LLDMIPCGLTKNGRSGLQPVLRREQPVPFQDLTILNII